MSPPIRPTAPPVPPAPASKMYRFSPLEVAGSRPAPEETETMSSRFSKKGSPKSERELPLESTKARSSKLPAAR